MTLYTIKPWPEYAENLKEISKGHLDLNNPLDDAMAYVLNGGSILTSDADNQKGEFKLEGTLTIAQFSALGEMTGQEGYGYFEEVYMTEHNGKALPKLKGYKKGVGANI